MSGSESLSVKDFGATGDGKSLETESIQLALDRIRELGGGIVRFPPGVYVTGTLRVHSHTTLWLDPGARLTASTNLEDFPPKDFHDAKARLPFVNPDLTDRHLLLLYDVHDVCICGGGVIDGRGDAFWHPSPGPEEWIAAKPLQRPSPFLEFVRCADVRLQDITIHNSPGWTVSLLDCDRVQVRGVRIDNNLWGPNTDAFDISGSRDVMISDCHIVCGDDAFCLKTMPHTRTCERITITNCVMRTNCVGLKLGCLESHQDMRQIAFTNCVIYGSTRAVGIYGVRGSLYEDIVISNIVCDTRNKLILNRPIHIDLRSHDDGAPPGRLRNLVISNFIASTDGRLLMTAADGCRIENVVLRDIQLRYYGVDDPEPTGRGAGSTQFSNHSPDARAARAAVVVDGLENLQIHNLSIQWPDEGAQVPMHAFWLRNVRGAVIDAPFAKASRAGVADVCNLDSDVESRTT